MGHSVRLACLRHAASVHPEPGSNSPKKLYFYIIYFVKLISDFEFKNWRFAQFSKIISACLSSALPIYHLIIGKSSTFCIFIRPFFQPFKMLSFLKYCSNISNQNIIVKRFFLFFYFFTILCKIRPNVSTYLGWHTSFDSTLLGWQCFVFCFFNSLYYIIFYL